MAYINILDIFHYRNNTAYQRLFGGGGKQYHTGGEVFTAILRDFLGKGE